MHSVLVLCGGFTLLAALLLIGRLLGLRYSTSAIAFVPLWFAAAAINMWVGVTQAGYTVAQEFPIFIGIFAVPTVVAMTVWWKNARG